MFSLENLAWRTSNTPGFSTSDLPVCERGPNGGRVMWFPPYGLTFSESVTANWNTSEFLGRPEPIYTYKSTNRGGTLTWKIVVDHPSVLNVIVNKVLANETNRVRIDSILESFFAGCRKYDIYELAKKYQTVNPNDLFQLQQAITSKEMTREQIEYTRKTIESGVNSPNGADQSLSQSTINSEVEALLQKYVNLGLYFGNDYPKQSGTVNYDTEYNRYTSTTNRQYYNSKPNAGETSTFFDTVVTPNYKVAQQFCTDLAKILETNTEGNITLNVDSSCSAPATIAYNVELSRRRIQSMVEFFVNNTALTKYTTSSPKRLIVLGGNPAGEQTTVSQVKKGTAGQTVFNADSLTNLGKTFNCTDNDVQAAGGDTQSGSKDIFTVPSMACRRAFIKSASTTIQAPKSDPVPNKIDVLVGNVITETVRTEEVTQEWKPRDNITKKVVRALLSECDYFETIKEETPMVYDNLKDKLKFFQPAFHSTTPEGLNSRLTFLQQCMRPGDTIPTIKQPTPGSKPVLEYNNAVNTAFGAPPVLVLRVGDFYNTKIIPNNLSIQYEGLDINPEGIGVQPMIANVTLSFNFVGGSGLKESIDKLQNALTFNYYANTEIYDDRADSTDIESSKILDQIFLAGQTPPPIPGANSAAPNNGQSNNTAIGTVISSSATTSGTTGVISYSDFMETFRTDTQTYFTNVVNKTKETINQYNNAVRQQWLLERNYTQGNFNVNSPNVVLFGKPNNVEKRFDEIFAELDNNIKNGSEGFIQFISDKSKNFSEKLIRTVKENYSNFVSKKRGSFQNAISKITQDLVNQEQSYLQTIGRVNIITYKGTTFDSGTDGFQTNNGPVTTYVTLGTSRVTKGSTATNTLNELVDDVKKIQQDIAGFNQVISSNSKFSFNSTEYEGIFVFQVDNGKSKAVTTQQVFLPFSRNANFENNVFRRVYMIVSDDVVDDKKYQTFKQQIIGNVIGNQTVIGNGSAEIEAMFNLYWEKTAKPAFLEENNISKSFVDNLEKNGLKNYLVYTPFSKKDREFTFTTENPSTTDKKKSQENMIKGLANTTNQNTNVLTWNDTNGNSTGAFISKAKLN